MGKKGKYYGVKCDGGYLVGKDRKPIVADKKSKGKLEGFLKKLKKGDQKKYDSCTIIDVSDKMK